MYVSWCPADGFELWEKRPSYEPSPMGGKRWYGEELLCDESLSTLPGFPVPAHPTLWEVTADGVRVVERVE